MSPEEEVIRAGHAREMLDNALFKEMREHIRSRIDAQIVAAPISDQTLHTRLVMMAQLWHAIEQWFQQVADTGELAGIQIEQERQKRSLFGSLRGP